MVSKTVVGFSAVFPRCLAAVFVATSLSFSLQTSALAQTTNRYIVSPSPYTTGTAATLLRKNKDAAVQALAREGLVAEEKLEIISGAVVTLTDDEANALANELESKHFIVEPDYPVAMAAVPNDTDYNVYQGDLVSIRAPQAWDITKGSSSVVVAVLDTGIDYTHPDLSANMWRNSGEVAANGVDDDGNGVIDDVHGVNYVSNNGNPYDDHYHGTHVAGTIGASTNNGLGVAGINWNVKLMGIKVLGANGSGYTSGLILGVQYATMMKNRGVNVRVINASLGGGGYTSAFQTAINAAYSAGILFVAAAGNNGTNNDTSPFYPANYANVVSVAATTNSGVKASFSNYGASTVHIAAPGVSIRSTIPVASYPSGYGNLSGTSMAAPHVAGVAALALSVYPTWTSAQLRTRLLSTVSTLPALSGVVSTSGFLDAYNAVQVPTYSISGTVTLAGVPLSGALVNAGGLGSAVTGTNGQYSIPNVLPGSAYTVTVSKLGYSFLPASISGISSSNVVANFTGAAVNYTISGTITVGGAPLPGVTVDGGPIGVTTTNANGQYSFGALTYGTAYTITPALAGYNFLPGNVSGTVFLSTAHNFQATLGNGSNDPDPNDPDDPDSTNPPELFTLKGKVVSKGEPLAGVKVTGTFGTATTNKHGNFTFSNIAEGTSFQLKLSKKNFTFYPTIVTGEVNSNINFKVQAQSKNSRTKVRTKKKRSKIMEIGPSGTLSVVKK